jgi:hypothetical protein
MTRNHSTGGKEGNEGGGPNVFPSFALLPFVQILSAQYPVDPVILSWSGGTGLKTIRGHALTGLSGFTG